MAAPLVQRVVLDKAEADRQLAQLQRQLAALNKPIDIPVDIETDQALDRLQRDIAQADAQTIDIDVDVDGIDRAERQMGELGREVDQAGDEFDVLRRKADDSQEAILRVGTRGASAFTSLRGSVLAVGAAFAAIQGVQVLGRGAAAAIQAASDLEESLSKTNVVFEEFSGEIQTFASTAPAALGLTTAAALESTATFGNLFVALGLSREAAADLAPEIIQLASDLASFNNIQVTEAVEKLRAGLVGEVEPLRTLGVNLNATLVEAKALELGLVDSAGAVTEAGKVQARYALILEQTTTAQGDYARTSDGIANTQRTLQAEFGNLAVKIGQALLPAYQAILDLSPAILSAVADLTPVIANFAATAAGAAPSVSAFAEAIQVLSAVPTALGVLKEVTDVPRDLALGFGLLLGLDVPGGLNQIREGLVSIQTAADNFRLESLRQGLVNSLQAGIDPARALADALAELENLNLDSAALEREAAALTAISGVDLSRGRDVAEVIREQGEAAGIAADKIDLLADAVLKTFQLPTPLRPGASAGGRQAQEARDAAAAEQSILSEIDALGQLQIAADAASTTIFGLLSSQQELPAGTQAAADALSQSTLTYLAQVDAINALDIATGALPGTIEAAADAMRDAEGEMVADFDTFLANLRTSVAEQQEFDLGLALLRAMGLDDLAAQFETAGVEALALVNEALADPTGAEEAERLIDGRYVGVGEGIKADIMEGLEGEEINTALVQNLIDAAAEADTPEVRAALLALAEELRVEIPISFGQIPAFLESPRVPDRSNAGSDSGRSDLQSADIAVTNNFFTEPQPTTQTQRAAAETASIISYAQGRAV